ncbi:MAG: hypothetical protein ABIV21_06570, partial [Pyrinomonadaceae bacterium]
PIILSTREALTYLVLIGLGVGLLLGLFPLVLGIRRGKKKYGIIGLVASILVGGLSPILAVIVAGIFTWLIHRNKRAIEDPTVRSSENT